MKKIVLPLVAIILTLLSACIPSIHPFFKDTDVVFDARLVGTWQPKETDNTEQWKFTAMPGKQYDLCVSEKGGKSGDFVAHLFKLKNHLFLDLTPRHVEFAANQTDLIAFAAIPGHLLLRVYQLEPTLKLAFCDFKWLEGFVKKNPGAVAHRMNDTSLFLTAETHALQRFVLAHLAEGELFGKAEDAQEMESNTATVPIPAAASSR